MVANFVHVLWSSALLTCIAAFDPSESFSHSLVLNPSYTVFWNLTGLQHTDNITFEIHAKTLGWVGIGFSPNGGMKGADIVVGGFNDATQKPYLYDRYGTQNGFPPEDTVNNYELLLAKQNATHTVMKFRRRLLTCDDQDWPINNETVRLIWAMNPTDATSSRSFAYHESRGTRSVLFLQPMKYEGYYVVPPDTNVLEFKVNNLKVPDDYHTLYWCKIFKLPDWPKQHIIHYEAIVQPGNELYLHHILIYHCVYNMSDWVDKEEACFEKNGLNMSAMYRCTSRYIAGWAVGASPVTNPDFLGYPIMENGSSPFILLEIHYDNSNYRKGVVDNSGMRLYMTPKLRPMEIGSMMIGMGTSEDSIIIPPRQNKFTLRSFCSPECTAPLPQEGITVHWGFLHAHTSGRAIRLRQVRNGVELEPILDDNHYDFNFQEFRNPNRPVKIMPKDLLIVECEFDTSQRDKPTYGGFATQNEMCVVFVDYYPRTKALMGCFSSPAPFTYASAMNLTISKSKEKFFDPLTNKSVTPVDYAMTYDFGTPTQGNALSIAAKNYESALQNGIHWLACGGGRAPESEGMMMGGMSDFINVTASDELEKTNVNFTLLEFPEPTYVYTYNHPCFPAVRDAAAAPTGSSASSITTAISPTASSVYQSMFYEHKVVLAGGKYILSWNITNKETIDFEILAQATGWVGFGLSPNGGMAGADIMIGWIDSNGRPQISDRYATHNGMPEKDAQQDYVLKRGFKNATHIAIAAQRKLTTCDKDDRPFTTNTERVIWAFSNEVPTTDMNIMYHGASNRGAKSLYFLDPPRNELTTLPPGTIIMDYLANQTAVPSDRRTLYHCQIFAVNITDKMHLIKFEPVVQPGHESIVHHLLLYGCSHPVLENLVGHSEPCFNPDATKFSAMYSCLDHVVASWAVGGEAFTLPPDRGLPISSSAYKYFMMEVHYDNPLGLKGVYDNSGLRIYLTSTLRPIEMGQMTVGTPVGKQFQIIPPGMPEFTTYAYCVKNSTKQLPKQGINVTAAMLHSHLAGRKIRVRHIRDGIEQKMLFDDEHYDFNYQDHRILPTPVTILPGDELVTECVYDTSDRTNVTWGHFATTDEMCLVFIDYYPKIPMTQCMSFPNTQDILASINLTLSDDSETLLNPFAKNRTFTDYLSNTFVWDNTSRRVFQNAARDSLHICLSSQNDPDTASMSVQLASKLANGTDRENTTTGRKFEYFPHQGYITVTQWFKTPDVCLNTSPSAQQPQQAIPTVKPGGTAATISRLTMGHLFAWVFSFSIGNTFIFRHYGG